MSSPIISALASGFGKQPNIPSLVDLQRKDAELQQVQSETALRNAEAVKAAREATALAKKAKQDAADDQIEAAAWTGALGQDGSFDDSKYAQAMKKASPQRAFAGLKHVSELRNSALGNDKQRNDALIAGNARFADIAGTAKDPESTKVAFETAVNEGLLKPEEVPTFETDGQALDWLKHHGTVALGQAGVIKQAKAQQEIDDAKANADRAGAGEARTVETFNTNRPAIAAEAATRTAVANATAQDPDLLTPIARQEATSRKQTADLAQRKFDQDLTDFAEKVRHNKADESEMQRYHNMSFEGVSLTADAKAKMAEMFATTGVLPALGQGKAAAQTRSEIINAAAKQFPQVDFASNKAAYQANSTSLKNLQKQQDSIESFENTAGKNLDQFLQTAKGVIDSGSPLINQPVRVIAGTVFGGKNQKAFDVARQVAVTEIAKVLNNPNGNAALSDSARKEVMGLIGPDATLGQIYQASQILRTDMKNRLDSGKEQIAAIQGRISGGSELAHKKIQARDPQGKLHEADPGTTLPPGWKLEP